MDEKIIFEGKTQQGQQFIIRYPKKGDEKLMLDYINVLSKEQSFIRLQGEQLKLEDEKKYLNEQLDKIINNKAVLLFVVINEKVFGISGIDLRDRTEQHEGVFAISIAKEFRGQGIGKILMQSVVDEAVKDMPMLKIITLGVFESNDMAFEMYKRYGFKEYGRLPNGLFRKGRYEDHILMYKNVGDFK